MNDCPEKDCKQRGEDTHAEVFDKPDGLKERVRKAERAIWGIPLLIIIVGSIGSILYAKGEKNADNNVATATRVTRLEEKYASINKNQEETLKLLKQLVTEKEDKNKDKEKDGG